MIKRFLIFVLVYLLLQMSWDLWFVAVGNSNGWTVEALTQWENSWSTGATLVFFARCVVGFLIADNITVWWLNRNID